MEIIPGDLNLSLNHLSPFKINITCVKIMKKYRVVIIVISYQLSVIGYKLLRGIKTKN